MKNKGFTLVEILAVIVILGILATMATIGITRYMKHVYEKDLGNLHSSLETTFTNYRVELANSGDSHLTSVTIDNDVPLEFNKYINDLTFRGGHLNRTVLFGTVINLYTKGTILSNSNYSSDIAKNISNFSSLSDDEQFSLLEKQYIIDGTCMTEASLENVDVTGTPENHCKMENGQPTPSKDEIICQKVIHNGETVIDDYGNTENALSFNPLCSYLSN